VHKSLAWIITFVRVRVCVVRVCTDSYLHYLNANDEDIKKNIYIYIYTSFMCVFCLRVSRFGERFPRSRTFRIRAWQREITRKASAFSACKEVNVFLERENKRNYHVDDYDSYLG